VPLDEFNRNDQLKRERAVEKIDADLVLDNNGSFEDSLESFIRFTNGKRVTDEEG
jgi:hypothetical protein